MIHKICNYLALLSLAFVLSGTSAAAYPNNPKTKSISVSNSKKFSFYHRILNAEEKDSYAVKVEEGKTLRILINANQDVALTVQSPDGSVKTYEANKYFKVKVLTPGEYVIGVQSSAFSMYKMEISNR